MTYNEQRDNYVRMAAKRIAQLERQLAAKKITQAKYDAEMVIVSNAAPADADAEFWDDVWDEVLSNVGELPGKIQSTVASGSNWLGQTAGSISGEFTKGLFKGWANPVSLTVAAVTLAVIVWAFWKGPLRGAKIKTIPL